MYTQSAVRDGVGRKEGRSGSAYTGKSARRLACYIRMSACSPIGRRAAISFSDNPATVSQSNLTCQFSFPLEGEMTLNAYFKALCGKFRIPSLIYSPLQVLPRYPDPCKIYTTLFDSALDLVPTTWVSKHKLSKCRDFTAAGPKLQVRASCAFEPVRVPQHGGSWRQNHQIWELQYSYVN